MNLIEKATIMHFHRQRIADNPDEAVRALGWKKEESQQKRYETLTSIGDLNRCSVLDVGCGYGDLKSFLDQKFTGGRYLGIDQMPEFIAEAENRYRGESDTFFFCADFSSVIFPPVDYVLASGALAYRCDNPLFYGEMISKMLETATKGVAFNMLDAEFFEEGPLLIGHNRETMREFCEYLCDEVHLVRGYLEDDFTIFMKK